jgi:hypothetical protein
LYGTPATPREWLSFDSPTSIRDQLKGQQGRQIEIEATLDASCLTQGVIAQTKEETVIQWCGDAATVLKNPIILDIQ